MDTVYCQHFVRVQHVYWMSPLKLQSKLVSDTHLKSDCADDLSSFLVSFHFYLIKHTHTHTWARAPLANTWEKEYITWCRGMSTTVRSQKSPFNLLIYFENDFKSISYEWGGGHALIIIPPNTFKMIINNELFSTYTHVLHIASGCALSCVSVCVLPAAAATVCAKSPFAIRYAHRSPWTAQNAQDRDIENVGLFTRHRR